MPNVEEKWDSPDLDEMLKYDRRKPEEHPLMKKYLYSQRDSLSPQLP